MESMYHYNVINYKFIHRAVSLDLDDYFMTAYNEKWDDKLVNNDFSKMWLWWRCYIKVGFSCTQKDMID